MESYKVKNAPPTFYYVPDFINAIEEQYIFEKVQNAPKSRWVQLSNRRLQNWGGTPTAKGMIPEIIPEWLLFYVNKINDLNFFGDPSIKINHVLINEYTPGQGIMPHEDGPVFMPTIITLTCGSPTVLKFHKKRTSEDYAYNERDNSLSMYLERRSLVVVKDNLYTDYLHSIEEKMSDTVDHTIINLNKIATKPNSTVQRGTRISLTLRHVIKISKFKLSFSTHK